MGRFREGSFYQNAGMREGGRGKGEGLEEYDSPVIGGMAEGGVVWCGR